MHGSVRPVCVSPRAAHVAIPARAFASRSQWTRPPGVEGALISARVLQPSEHQRPIAQSSTTPDGQGTASLGLDGNRVTYYTVSMKWPYRFRAIKTPSPVSRRQM